MQVKICQVQFKPTEGRKEIEQVLINEQGGNLFHFFKQADPKKCMQGWQKI